MGYVYRDACMGTGNVTRLVKHFTDITIIWVSVIRQAAADQELPQMHIMSRKVSSESTKQ
jgi:hypothetical protein